ncbi:senescence/dehydration-associated protein, chloroplastic [Cinnamomum micranthum f. kanehirae]|uniref:Senescence/dehydration-associated protein, chloroplastic n=1 Tax=Cinnamomum micranthum f. kanehirae TaxID=337451 RepID=A0A443NIC7_9MAGN|nr:senescence/dehydration-associated protein, chloroplastic [Cinnamomum micranthum f. kanehirae]
MDLIVFGVTIGMLPCFVVRSARNKKIEPPHKTVTSETSIPLRSEAPMTKTNEEILITIPGATLHLVEEGETTELDKGELAIIRLTQENVVLATLIKIGTDLQWPLTKDEPVIKLDQLHYLFSLPSGDGSFLNYGVTFSKPNSGLAVLDSFFMENSCFSSPSTTTAAAAKSSYPPGVYWKDFAPRVDDYNGVLAKAIAGGTGEIIKGIFKCSNAYAQQNQPHLEFRGLGESTSPNASGSVTEPAPTELRDLGESTSPNASGSVTEPTPTELRGLGGSTSPNASGSVTEPAPSRASRPR